MYYGFDIGGTKIEIGVFDEQMNEIWKKRVPTPQSSYEDFLEAVTALTLEADEKHAIKGNIGLGIPGIINRKAGTVFTTNIAVVKNKPLLHDLKLKLNRPIYADNDANCFALSEAHQNDIKHHKNVLGLILGTGLGGGLIINGQTVEGANGCGAEVGHVRLPIDAYQMIPNHPPLFLCGCGNKGCSERYLSGTGMAQLYAFLYQEPLKAQQIINRYHEKNPQALEFIDLFVEMLAAYLGSLLAVLDSDVIVLGGGLSNFDLLYLELPKRIPNYMLPNTKVPQIRKAFFGDSGGTRGAALLPQVAL